MRSNWQTNTKLSVVFVALIDTRVSLMFKSTETFYQGFGQKLVVKPNLHLQIFDLKRIRNFNSNQQIILLPQRETI